MDVLVIASRHIADLDTIFEDSDSPSIVRVLRLKCEREPITAFNLRGAKLSLFMADANDLKIERFHLLLRSF
jgi:hypothetical protein